MNTVTYCDGQHTKNSSCKVNYSRNRLMTCDDAL